MINNVVYFTHENRKEALKFSKIISHNIKYNKDLEFKFYDSKKREEFIKKYYPEFYKFYIRIHTDYGAVKADIFRVLILYHNGGIYIDIKTKIKNIYQYLIKTKKSFYIGLTKYEDIILYTLLKFSNSEYSNWFIATEKKGEIITKIKNEMFKRLSNFDKISFNRFKYPFISGSATSGRLSAWYYTGPVLFTEIIKKSQSDIGIINDPNILIYDETSTCLKRFFFKNYKNTYHYSKNKLLIDISNQNDLGPTSFAIRVISSTNKWLFLIIFVVIIILFIFIFRFNSKLLRLGNRFSS